MAESLKIESPEYTKISHATAISLGLMKGRMYRGAVNRCANLLVHYPEGCFANCAYCGLARERAGAYQDKSFIHVSWPVFPMKEIIRVINQAPSYVKRTCISMITNRKCRPATIEMARMLGSETNLPFSILVAPTIINREDLISMRDAGVDKVGVAIDLATPELFDRYRGRGVKGPHRWDRYWKILENGLEIFGRYNVGAHLMAGMGETEEEMTGIMEKLWRMGIPNHLFSFFPEEGSGLSGRPQPAWSAYLRIQLARYLIEEDLVPCSGMGFDQQGHITDFGLDSGKLQEIIGLGIPFMTTGCVDREGNVACNRPFGNCLPDVKQWNYPYTPDEKELDLIRTHILKRF